MEKTAAVFPVLPGKDPLGPARMFEEQPDAYRKSRDRMGVRFERAYLMETPQGNFVVAYLESDRSFGETIGGLATSDLEIDKEFARHIKDIHGVDLTQPSPGEPPEILGDFVDPLVTTRKRGLAFCAPVMPGAEEKGRAFAKEAFEARRQEHTESRRKLGISREVVVLNHTPHGDVVAVYLEGDDPAEGNRKFAESRSEYDVWFKDRCKEIFPPEVDFNQPVPPIKEIFDSERVPVSR